MFKNKNFNGHCGGACGGGAFYGLGFVGAVVYYIQHATSFSSALFGIFKALIWPALLIYKVIALLKI